MRSSRLVLFGLAAALHAAPAAARSASAEAFGFCREQEKAGDARACWSVWLDRFRATGSEAELAYAHGATAARLTLTSTPSAVVTLDGKSLGATPLESVVVPAGEHRLGFTGRSHTENRTITVEAGETRLVDVQLDPPPPAPRAPVASPPRGPTGDVLDFCALSPSKGPRKERVVLFAPSGTNGVNNSAELRALDGARVVRDVFTARFALDRFHNVLSSLAAKKGWEARESLSIGEVRAFLRDAREHGDVEQEARVERERRFVAYSVGCADYLAIPTITSYAASWDTSKVTPEDGATRAHPLSFTINGALGIFRRKGDRFERVALLNASAPSFGASRSPDDSLPPPRPRAFPAYVSGVPDPACVEAGREGAPGLARCAPKGEGTAEQALGMLDEHASEACTRARDAATPDAERRPLAVQCELRARSYELARAFQVDARRIKGWMVFGVLAHASAPASLALGRADGLEIGDAFQVIDDQDRRVAFYKVAQVGPGGAAGESAPSILQPITGDAPAGARLHVVPRLGLVIAPYASVGMLTYSYGTTRVVSGDTFQDFTLPSAVFGGGATLGLDVSALVRSTDTFVRVGAGIFTGSGLNTAATLVPIDLWIEKGFWLARRLALTAAVGGTVQISSVNVLTALDGIDEDLHVSSTMFGPAARLGLDVLLHPDWSLKIEAVARVPLNSATYVENDGKAIPPEWLGRDDHFATLAANLGIARTF